MRKVRNKEYFVVWCPIDLRRLVCKKWFPVVVAITSCVLGPSAALQSGSQVNVALFSKHIVCSRTIFGTLETSTAAG